MDTKTLLNVLAERLGRDPEDIEVVVGVMANVIGQQVQQGNVVSMPGFGSFEPKLRSERIATNPASGKKLLVPPKMSLVFKPSALLKQKVKK